MSPVGVAPSARVFYGWWVALAFVIIVFLTTGVRFTVGPFLKPIVSDLGLDRGSLSAFALLFFAVDPAMLMVDPAMLMVVAAFGGIGMSGSLAMVSALTADIFGRFSVGSIFGTIFLAHQVGAALGTWLGGALFDATGGYGAAFATTGALLLCAAGLSAAVRQGRPGPGRAGALIAPRPEPRPVAGGR